MHGLDTLAKLNRVAEDTARAPEYLAEAEARWKEHSPLDEAYKEYLQKAPAAGV